MSILVLLIVLQSVLRLSLWRSHWLRACYGLAVGCVTYACLDTALSLSKPQVAAWLADKNVLQDVAVLCLADALLLRWRHYPGLLMLPAAFFLLTQFLFRAAGFDFHLVAILTALALSLALPAMALLFSWVLPRSDDRRALHLLLTVVVCLAALALSSFTQLPLTFQTNQNIIMQYISQTLFGIANMLLIPDILLLLVFFVRALVLMVSTYRQYAVRRRNGHGTLYAKYRDQLYAQSPDEAYADFVATQFEAEAAKDVNLSRLLTKLGPVLGLIGTLISMSPALVGLSTGDISGMAYNMQVVFSATVVGLVISVVGLFTQQLKSRWYAKDLGRLDYVSRLYVERHEKEA